MLRRFSRKFPRFVRFYSEVNSAATPLWLLRDARARSQGATTTTSSPSQSPSDSLSSFPFSMVPQYSTHQISTAKSLFRPDSCSLYKVLATADAISAFGTELVTHRGRKVLFVGRSNVGKSSIINALTCRQVGSRKLAITSKTPGRTQQLNVFAVGPSPTKHPWLIDAPGYGYAKAPVKVVRHFQQLLVDFLAIHGSALSRVFVLVDSRRGLLEIDMELIQLLLEYKCSFQLVLTKADCLSIQDLRDLLSRLRLDLVLDAFSGDVRHLIPDYHHLVSSRLSFGIDALRCSVLGLTPELIQPAPVASFAPDLDAYLSIEREVEKRLSGVDK